MKKWTVLLVTLTLLFTLTACGSKDDNSKGEEDSNDQKMEDVQTNGSDAEEQTFTGILEDKTNFMLVVNSEDGKNSYIFNLEEELVSDAQTGDKVTITYKGDLSKFNPADDSGQLIATKVEKAN